MRRDAGVDQRDVECPAWLLARLHLLDLDLRWGAEEAEQCVAEHARRDRHEETSLDEDHPIRELHPSAGRIPRTGEVPSMTPFDRTPLVVVDDHAVMGHALAMSLQLQGFEAARSVHVHDDMSDEDVVAEVRAAGDGQVVLLDLHLGDDRLSTTLIRPLCDLGARVLVLTAEHDTVLLGSCLEHGADGVFDKAQPFDQLVETLHDAVRGLTVMSVSAREELLAGLRTARRSDERRLAPFEALTGREQDVLRGLLAGESVEAIARSRVVALSTVRSHVKSVLRKLGVNSQLAAVALAREAGWPPE